MRPVPYLYRRIVEAFEIRRCEMQLSQEALADLAGTADRSFSKCLRPDTPSGRLALMETLDAYATVLWADGFEIEIKAVEKPRLMTRAGLKRLIAERRSAKFSLKYMVTALERRGFVVIPPHSVEKAHAVRRNEAQAAI